MCVCVYVCLRLSARVHMGCFVQADMSFISMIRDTNALSTSVANLMKEEAQGGFGLPLDEALELLKTVTPWVICVSACDCTLF